VLKLIHIFIQSSKAKRGKRKDEALLRSLVREKKLAIEVDPMASLGQSCPKDLPSDETASEKESLSKYYCHLLQLRENIMGSEMSGVPIKSCHSQKFC